MALIACTECGKEISDKAAACPHCGAPRAEPPETGPRPATQWKDAYCSKCGEDCSTTDLVCQSCGASFSATSTERAVPKRSDSAPAAGRTERPTVFKTAKSRGVYIILGLFFGLLGIHNFYAGRLGVGVAQLLVTCILGWFVVGIVITAIWVLVELFIITHDGAGDAFA